LWLRKNITLTLRNFSIINISTTTVLLADFLLLTAVDIYLHPASITTTVLIIIIVIIRRRKKEEKEQFCHNVLLLRPAYVGFESNNVHNFQYLLPRLFAMFPGRSVLVHFRSIDGIHYSVTQHTAQLRLPLRMSTIINNITQPRTGTLCANRKRPRSSSIKVCISRINLPANSTDIKVSQSMGLHYGTVSHLLSATMSRSGTDCKHLFREY